MTSSEWIAKITSIDDSTADGNLRGIRVYGNCYDQRTDRLAASLAKSGKGPLMSARGNFRDFEQSLESFTKKAVAGSPPADAVKSAYAGLYEKQFRYAFYQSYEHQTARPTAAAKPSAKGDAPASKPPLKSAPEAPATPSDTSASNSPASTKDVDPLTLAKNRFGELLSDLPDDKMHDLHAAFGEVLVRNSVGAGMQLAIYQYAIFLLEPSSDKPFAPPPV